MTDETPFHCIGKDAFKTPALAAKVAKRGKGKTHPTHPYRCDHCGLWHVGSPGKKREWNGKKRASKRPADAGRSPGRMSLEDWKSRR